MTAIPPDVLDALGQLNAHARAMCGGGKRAVYAYKALAARLLAEAGALNATTVDVLVKCHGCDGTATFRYWDGRSGGPCRTCNRRGYIRLQFVVTSHDERSWHHPWQHGGRGILQAAWRAVRIDWIEADRYAAILGDGTPWPITWHDPGDWQPNRPVERLPGETAVELLNVVERWVLSLPDRLSWNARHYMPRYTIDLGHIGSCCYNCGAPDVSLWCGKTRSRSRLQWAEPLCATCNQIEPKVWPDELRDDELSPAVLEWLASPLRQGQMSNEDVWS